MSAAQRLTAWAVEALAAGARAMSWRGSLGMGATLGDLARTLGIRRNVAAENLALAFPDRDPAWRERVLAEHYRELGRVMVEYARLGELARAPRGEVMAEIRGLEHLEESRARGRGAILLSAHCGNIELYGAVLGQIHPVDFVVRPLTNPGVETFIDRARAGAGVGRISADRGIRDVYTALQANRWIAMLADQDARRHGVFVPFFGRPASTAIGPARIALATGADVVMGLGARRPDGRHELDVLPPLRIEDPDAPDAALRLTALHVRTLEDWVRQHPESWFWVHKRWKTRPPAGAAASIAAKREVTAPAPGALPGSGERR